MTIHTKKTIDLEIALYDKEIAALITVEEIFRDLDNLIQQETHDQFNLNDFLNHGAYGTDIIDILDDLKRHTEHFASYLADFIQENSDTIV